MFLPGQCYQFIHISCCGMHPFRSQGIHDSSHFVYRDAAHGCRISFQQDIEQAYCRVSLKSSPFSGSLKQWRIISASVGKA